MGDSITEQKGTDGRTLGLWGATSVGVGAIVGGGILALAGVAFATTGPGAILAFALNGMIALLTALSFAELSARFPESGGTYMYARKAMSIESAFVVGWVVWFASVVAAVLYALGFAYFLLPVLVQLWGICGGTAPSWLLSSFTLRIFALAALGFYTFSLVRSASGGGQWATIGKVVIFIILIVGGLVVLIAGGPSPEEMSTQFRPFLTDGATGLVQAMGYSFIALQGFDLIAAIGGEVRKPERTIPRAMLLSLGAALLIYLPLLFLIIMVGSPDRPVGETAAENPEILVAEAVRNFLGPVGYWLVISAGIMSMLSALQANLLAASRFALTMAQDRTLPRMFAFVDPERHTPGPAIMMTGAVVAVVLIGIPDLAAAGAMSSLIFLTCFTLTHVIAFLVRKRALVPSPFQVPAFPLIPLAGGVTCMALALFQSAAVPSAGIMTALWLGLGVMLYIVRQGSRARVVDASNEAMNPELVRLRGHNPLVLVPIANPENAETMVSVADAMAPHTVARVLLLSVIPHPEEGWTPGEMPERLSDAQQILGGALSTAFAADLTPEALVTVSDEPWTEIARVALTYHCTTLLLGLGRLDDVLMTHSLEYLMEKVHSDVVILRAPKRWNVAHVRRILVPAGGRRDQSDLRARLLGNLCRMSPREVTYLQIVPESTGVEAITTARRSLQKLAWDEVSLHSTVEIEESNDPVSTLVRWAADCDLLILGLQRIGHGTKVFGDKVISIAELTNCPLMMIHRRT